MVALSYFNLPKQTTYLMRKESIKYIYEAPALLRMSLIEMQFIKKVCGLFAHMILCFVRVFSQN